MSIKIGHTYRHKKTGGRYEAEGLMKLQISHETLMKVCPFLNKVQALDICFGLERISFVSYSSRLDHNQIFGRPESEFLDGRFEIEE